VPILVLAADEASHGDKIGPSLFAAYGAYYQVWGSFVDEWEVIVRQGPNLWPYHSDDWHNPKWLRERNVTQDDTSKRECQLRELIARTPFLFHATSMVPGELFYSTIANNVPLSIHKKRWARWLVLPYHFCHADVVRKSIRFAANWNQTSTTCQIDSVNFLVDKNDVATEDATHNFNKAREMAPITISRLMGDHVPVSKERHAEVQAADLLASEYLKFYRNRARHAALDLVTNSHWIRTDWSPLRLRDVRDAFVGPMQRADKERTHLREVARSVYLPQDGPLEPDSNESPDVQS